MIFSTMTINIYTSMSYENKYIYLCERLSGNRFNNDIVNGEVSIRDKNNIEFVFVPGGDFIQGLSEGEYA